LALSTVPARSARQNASPSNPAIQIETVFSGSYVEGKGSESAIKADFEREVHALINSVLKEPRQDRKVWAENRGNFLHTGNEWLMTPEQVYQRLKDFEAAHPGVHFNAKTPLGSGRVETESPVRQAINKFDLPGTDQIRF